MLAMARCALLGDLPTFLRVVGDDHFESALGPGHLRDRRRFRLNLARSRGGDGPQANGTADCGQWTDGRHGRLSERHPMSLLGAPTNSSRALSTCPMRSLTCVA